MSYSSLSQNIVGGGCSPAEYRTVLVDNSGGPVGLGPCSSECSGYAVVTETGKECHVLQGTPTKQQPASWAPLILAGAAVLAVMYLMR